jgi:hypothetical protein
MKNPQSLTRIISVWTERDKDNTKWKLAHESLNSYYQKAVLGKYTVTNVRHLLRKARMTCKIKPRGQYVGMRSVENNFQEVGLSSYPVFIIIHCSVAFQNCYGAVNTVCLPFSLLWTGKSTVNPCLLHHCMLSLQGVHGLPF